MKKIKLYKLEANTELLQCIQNETRPQFSFQGGKIICKSIKTQEDYTYITLIKIINNNNLITDELLNLDVVTSDLLYPKSFCEVHYIIIYQNKYIAGVAAQKGNSIKVFETLLNYYKKQLKNKDINTRFTFSQVNDSNILQYVKDYFSYFKSIKFRLEVFNKQMLENVKNNEYLKDYYNILVGSKSNKVEINITNTAGMGIIKADEDIFNFLDNLIKNDAITALKVRGEDVKCDRIRELDILSKNLIYEYDDKQLFDEEILFYDEEKANFLLENAINLITGKIF